MKTALALSVLFSLSAGLVAQSKTAAATGLPSQPGTSAAAEPSAATLNAILADIKRTSESTNLDLGKLRIEKWKVDATQKQQMQEIADSLQKNITMAVPGLITDAQASPGGVSKPFALYHDLNVVYDDLSSLAEATGAYGKREEYMPLANDVSALGGARRNLSNYIEQAASRLEKKAQQAAPPQAQAQPTPTPKKIIIDDEPPAKKPVKKKKPAAKPSPTPTPTPSQ